MRLLLDSNAVLWWLDADDRLGRRCRGEISAADVLVSAVTPWELGIKRARGNLAYPDDLLVRLSSGGFTELAITSEHGEHAAALPLHHRDPFDRMLVAQAQLERLVLVTADDALARYDVEILDARQ